MTDSYSGEPPFKGNMKMLPAGGKDNAIKDEGFTERDHDNPPLPPLKVEVKRPSLPISPEKKLKVWNEKGSDPEKIRNKLEEVLSHTNRNGFSYSMRTLIGDVYLPSVNLQ